MIRLTEKRIPGVWAIFSVRKRYIDDKVTEATHLDALVNLGAGFDTLTFRLPTLVNGPVFEVDQPGDIESKRSKLNQALGTALTSHG